jgi:hypothetical protein
VVARVFLGAVTCDMRIHGENVRPCNLLIIPKGVLHGRPEAARDMVSKAASVVLVCGPSSLVGVGRSSGCGGTGQSGHHARCSVVSVIRFGRLAKTVRVVISTVYWVNPISADGRLLSSSRGASVKVRRRSWRAMPRRCTGLVVGGGSRDVRG